MTNLFVATPEDANICSINVGLNASQVSRLIDAIVGLTNTEYSKGSLQRNLDLNRPKSRKEPVFKNSQIKVSPNILNLRAGASKRLIEAMVPNGEISGESVVKLSLWAMGNRTSLNETSVLLPVLKWVNCILHYELCQTNQIENLYELFLQQIYY